MCGQFVWKFVFLKCLDFHFSKKWLKIVFENLFWYVLHNSSQKFQFQKTFWFIHGLNLTFPYLEWEIKHIKRYIILMLSRFGKKVEPFAQCQCIAWVLFRCKHKAVSCVVWYVMCVTIDCHGLDVTETDSRILLWVSL